LTIRSIDVSAADDGLLSGNLEVRFTFVVNGEARNWNYDNLGVGVTNIGIVFFVDVPVDTSTITLEVSGWEDDWVDDPLPGFTKVHSQSDNWGQGAQSGGASDSTITYRLNYDIVCAYETIYTVSKDILLAYARDRASTRKNARVPSNDLLQTWSIDRFRRAGWNMIQTTETTFVFHGYGNFPSLVEEKYGEKKEAQDRRRQR
jgi:hypothetical protein